MSKPRGRAPSPHDPAEVARISDAVYLIRLGKKDADALMEKEDAVKILRSRSTAYAPIVKAVLDVLHQDEVARVG